MDKTKLIATLTSDSAFDQITEVMVMENEYKFFASIDATYVGIGNKKLLNDIMARGGSDFQGLTSLRLFQSTLILFKDDEILITIQYSSRYLHFDMHAKDLAILTKYEVICQAIADSHAITSEDISITIDLVSINSGKLLTTQFIEPITETVIDCAYPNIIEKYGSLQEFSKQFYESSENVLILRGPAGTGKTKLLRKILKEFSLLGDEDVSILYINNSGAAEQDVLYTQFITGEYDALVIEDVDQLLNDRSEGNDVMSNFLCAADGIIQSNPKKIFFTTNLPNELYIDDALLRDGRCFDTVKIDPLTSVQARKVLVELEGEEKADKHDLIQNTTLATLYKMAGITQHKQVVKLKTTSIWGEDED